ncbi:MAG: EamA family transporter, partial [Anaeromyxobacteraceae bacterium]
VALALACTAVAYVLYFRLIARVGPARAIAVTFLIPPFAVTWGGIFLGERLTLRTVLGAAVVLAGTALATGLVKLAGAQEEIYDAPAPPPARGATP